MRKWAWWTALAIVFVLIAAAFSSALCSPGRPLSPATRTSSSIAPTFTIPAALCSTSLYKQVDSFIAQAETFHRLKMPDRITVIASRSWTDFHMQSPWQRGNVIAGSTLQTGTVIWITPKVGEKQLDPAEFLRHELSHAILDQNTTLWRGPQTEQPAVVL